jgi:hypothetical protein
MNNQGLEGHAYSHGQRRMTRCGMKGAAAINKVTLRLD